MCRMGLALMCCILPVGLAEDGECPSGPPTTQPVERPWLSYEEYGRPLVEQGYLALMLPLERETLTNSRTGGISFAPHYSVVDGRQAEVESWIDLTAWGKHAQDPVITNVLPLRPGLYVERVFPSLCVHVRVRPGEVPAQDDDNLRVAYILIETTCQTEPSKLHRIVADYEGSFLKTHQECTGPEEWWAHRKLASAELHRKNHHISEVLRRRPHLSTFGASAPDAHDECIPWEEPLTCKLKCIVDPGPPEYRGCHGQYSTLPDICDLGPSAYKCVGQHCHGCVPCVDRACGWADYSLCVSWCSGNWEEPPPYPDP